MRSWFEILSCQLVLPMSGDPKCSVPTAVRLSKLTRDKVGCALVVVAVCKPDSWSNPDE